MARSAVDRVARIEIIARRTAVFSILAVDTELDPGPGLIENIDRLVRQKTVREIAI